MTREDFDRWIAAYERAWRSPGTEALDELFSEAATYRTAPFEMPYQGRGAIAELWEAEREGPDEVFEISWELVAVEDDTAVARVEVAYGKTAERTYRDLWVIRLDRDRRCREFEEWPFWPADSVGTHAPGPSQS